MVLVARRRQPLNLFAQDLTDAGVLSSAAPLRRHQSHMTPCAGTRPRHARARRLLDRRDPPPRPDRHPAPDCCLLGLRLGDRATASSLAGRQATADRLAGATTLYRFGRLCAPPTFAEGPEALCATMMYTQSV